MPTEFDAHSKAECVYVLVESIDELVLVAIDGDLVCKVGGDSAFIDSPNAGAGQQR